MKAATTEPVTHKNQDNPRESKSPKTDKPKAEYSVYIYHRDDDHAAPQRWEKMHSTHFVDQAIKRAKILYKSEKYDKVEVKKKSVHHRSQRTMDETYKVYSCQAMSPRIDRKMLCYIALSFMILGAFLYLFAF